MEFINAMVPVITLLIAFAAIVFLISGIDDLLMVIQLIVRFAGTASVYGPIHGILSLPRAAWGNFINFLATARALTLYGKARRAGDAAIPWDKTDHEVPRFP